MKIWISLAADTGWFSVRPLKEGARAYRLPEVRPFMWCRRIGTKYQVFYPDPRLGPYLPAITESDMKKYFETMRIHGKATMATPKQVTDIEYNLARYLDR